ncbi:MAG: DUF4259 domain-containing protein [Paracoccaceae bacterium]
MGAWGIGIFENDDAMDWLLEFAQVGAVAIAGAMTDVRDSAQNGYIEVDAGSRLLAACDITAAARGYPSSPKPDFTGAVDVEAFWTFVEDRLGLEPEDAIACSDAISLVTDDPSQSELMGLWGDGGEASLKPFLATVDDLQKRLAEASR